VSNSQKSFSGAIHAMRGIAALFVMWSHLVGMWLYSNKLQWEPYTYFYNNLMLPFHLYHALGHFGVVIFFLISGYIISLASEKDSCGAFILKRLLRIFPVLFLAVGVMGVAQVAVSRAGLPAIPDGHVNTLRELVGAATLYDQTYLGKNDVLSVTWTLVIEVLFYAVVALIYPLMSSRPVLSSLALLAFGALVVAFNDVVPIWVAGLAPSFVYFPVFVVGRLTYLIHAGRITPPMFVSLVMLTAIVFVQLHDRLFPGVLFTKIDIVRAYTYLQACLVFWIVLMCGDVRNRVLAFFADISYSLYLLHIPVGYTFLTFTKDRLDYELALPLAVALTTLTSYLSWRYVERPGQSLARHIARRFL
jgi:peptidoglycan/LPS O-acetylase OafA/YrhL